MAISHKDQRSSVGIRVLSAGDLWFLARWRRAWRWAAETVGANGRSPLQYRTSTTSIKRDQSMKPMKPMKPTKLTRKPSAISAQSA